jgi:hypothetical protein
VPDHEVLQADQGETGILGHLGEHPPHVILVVTKVEIQIGVPEILPAVPFGVGYLDLPLQYMNLGLKGKCTLLKRSSPSWTTQTGHHLRPDHHNISKVIMIPWMEELPCVLATLTTISSIITDRLGHHQSIHVTPLPARLVLLPQTAHITVHHNRVLPLAIEEAGVGSNNSMARMVRMGELSSLEE